MSKKKRYNFTLDEDLMSWFKLYCKENRLTASAALNKMFYRVNLTDELPFVFLISNSVSTKSLIVSIWDTIKVN